MNFTSGFQLASATASYPHTEIGTKIFSFESDVIRRMSPDEAKDRLDRVQIEPAPGQYQFLVRHSTHGHWCGYVIIDEARWDRIGIENQRKIRDRCKRWAIPVSYAGHNNAIISWCTFTQRGKLSIPARVNPNGPDFMLGFTTQGLLHNGLMLDNYMATRILNEFAKQIHEGMHDYSSL